jgi:hypothetical protein
MFVSPARCSDYRRHLVRWPGSLMLKRGNQFGFDPRPAGFLDSRIASVHILLFFAFV